MITIYHNQRCTKSRETYSLLDKAKVNYKVVEYMKTPPSAVELKHILKKLKMKAEDVVRKGETLYKEKYKDKKFSEAEWIKILVKNPILIERPIVVKDDKAVIGRPPENIKKLL